MDARLAYAALLVAAVLACGAGRPPGNARSQHFVVSAPTQELAQEVCQAAETYRRDLAIEWLGHELPPWRDICPITVKLDPGAGGATSFVFQSGFPTQWTMQVQGTRERILDSVLPHEITHTVFATHFGGPLPRWADEGASTTVEHVSEKSKQDKLLIRYLTGPEIRSIPFNQLFAMKQYPHDIMPLYSEGYSLARYLIQQGGKQKFVAYVGEGMRSNNWPAATKKFYGYSSLSDLQVTWVKWVGQGSPDQSNAFAVAAANASQTAASGQMPATQLASLTQPIQSRIPDGPPPAWQAIQSQNTRALAQADQRPQPQATNFGANSAAAARASAAVSTVSHPIGDGWYARRRDQAQAVLRSSTTEEPAPEERVPPPPPAPAPGGADTLTPAIHSHPATDGGRRVLMEWTRPPNQPANARADLTGVALGDSGTLLR
jgi:hypothetical protein